MTQIIIGTTPTITYTFHTVSVFDLTKITIHVPAGSTTYTTLSTAYPTANIVTY